MSTFKRTNTRTFSKSGVKVTPDTIYWKRLQFPVTVKEFTSVSHIDVSPAEPHYIAVSSGPKVDVYHQQSLQVWRTLSRFQKLAYGASFRSDGQLLVAGSEEGQVKLFNYKQKQLLRIFKGHDGAVHEARFLHGTPRIASFSDDKTSVIWDITDESQICKLSEHTDFIRAGVTSQASEHIVISGAYDHTVKMWDTRTGSSVITVDHGAPVESLVCFPSGGVFVSAGGTHVKVWDVIGGRLLSKLSQHHKTITSLSLATDGKRLLSGSLDRHVKVYDVNTYAVVHTLDYPAPILCMAVAPGDTTVAVGMISEGSGLISFQHRWDTRQGEAVNEKPKKNIRNSITEDYKLAAGDKIVSHESKEIMSHYDTMLRKFQYSRALDVVMRRNVIGRSPHITVAIFQELIRRGGLRTALAGRDMKTLTPILRFVAKHIRDPSYKRVLMDVADTLIDVYGDTVGEFPALVNLFRRLQEQVELELRLIREHVSLMGAIQMFLTVSSPKSASNEPLRIASSGASGEGVMMPSQAAQTAPEVVVDVS